MWSRTALNPGSSRSFQISAALRGRPSRTSAICQEYTDRYMILGINETFNDCPTQSGGAMVNVLAWVLQVLLALVFLFHGAVYSLAPEPLIRGMREQGQWPPAIPGGFRVFIGIAEILAAIGLVLPSLTRVAPG